MKFKKTFSLLAGFVFLLLSTVAVPVFADEPFDSYGSYQGDATLPVVTGGWFTAYDYFPDTNASIDNFDGKGRLIAANNTTIYLQRTYGSSVWDPVATVPYTMDPSFIKVSPDGTQIALGCGYGAPLAIIETSSLSIDNPPLLFSGSSGNWVEGDGVKLFPAVNFYDGDWYDDQYFIIDGGNWPDLDPPYNPGDPNYYSGVGIVDTQAANRTDYEGRILLSPKSGASAGVGFDSEKNLFCGCGFGDNTGEIKVLDATLYDPANPPVPPISYDALTTIVLYGKNNGQIKLSAAYLNTDSGDNLTVGGGNCFDLDPPGVDYGYAASINNAVVDRVLTGGLPVDTTNSAEWQEFQPDPCRNDSATGIVPGLWDGALAVNYTLTTQEPNCAVRDDWNIGVTPLLKIYYPNGAPDNDGDGIPNSADNAYLSPNSGQQDTDGDGYGNACDADLDNDGVVVDINDRNLFSTAWDSTGPDLDADFDSDGVVDAIDYGIFKTYWDTTAPWY